MFLVAWVEMAQTKPLSVEPTFRRLLLNPRCPRFYDASLDNIYVRHLLSPSTPTKIESHHSYIGRIYYITAENINGLQSQASSNGCRRSKLESFSAFLWKIVAKAADDKVNKCKLGIAVDGRKRMARSGTSMSNYFGNVISIPYGELSIHELNTKPMSRVANSVLECLESTATEEHFLGLIDMVEAHWPEPLLARIYLTRKEDEVAFVVSSGLRFRVSKVDFGWSVPAFWSYYFPWDAQAGYVMLMPSPRGNGDWVVYMHLLKEHLDLLETEFSHVFSPFTSQYFNV